MTALLALASSWAAGWAVAFHLASDDHGGGVPSDRGARGLEMARHGHLHAAGTPAHGHPVVGSVAAPVPGRLSLLAPAMTGSTPEAVLPGPSSRRIAPLSGPSHDPPPRGASVSVLRI